MAIAGNGYCLLFDHKSRLRCDNYFHHQQSRGDEVLGRLTGRSRSGENNSTEGRAESLRSGALGAKAERSG